VRRVFTSRGCISEFGWVFAFSGGVGETREKRVWYGKQESRRISEEKVGGDCKYIPAYAGWGKRIVGLGRKGSERANLGGGREEKTK